MAKSFRQDALVWAKMKGFPPWPAKVTVPKDGKIPKTKKPQHYVFFFGTHDCAWIADQNIEAHSETMLANAKAIKKKSSTMQSGIEEIEEASKSAPPEDVPAPPREGSDEAEKEPTPESSPQPSEKPKKKVALKKKAILKVVKKVPKSIPKKSPKKRPAPDEDLDRDLSIMASNAPPHNTHLSSSLLTSTLEDDLTSLISHSYSNGTKAAGPSTSSKSNKISNKGKVKSNLQPTDKKIGFLGLGAMGFQMVERLLETKHKVTIWNRTRRDEFDQLTRAGAVLLPTPADVIRECDITVSCLSDSEAVKCVVYDTLGVLEGFDGACSKSYVEMSTIDPDMSQEIAEAITGKGGKYLEAPMFGSRQDIKAGKMVLLASGNHELFGECDTMFCAFALHAYYLGSKVGQGNKMSIVLNMWAGVSYAALAETLSLVRDSNIPPAFFVDLMKPCPFSCPLLMNRARAMTSPDDGEVSVPVKHQAKSLAVALSMGHAVQQPLALAVPSSAAFVRAIAEDEEMDVSSIFKTML